MKAMILKELKEMTQNGLKAELGKSVAGRKIECVRFGNGEKNILFIGGVHGDEYEGVDLIRRFIAHNKNSQIPTSYISTMTFDAQGNLYLATRQGLVKLEKNKQD